MPQNWQQMLKRLAPALIIITCLLYILLIRACLQAAAQFKELVQDTQEYVGCAEAAAQLAEGSDYLTDQARLYVSTLNRQNMDNYFTEAEQTRRRELALEAMLSYDPDEATYNYLTEALENSMLLMQREFYAMKLAAFSQGVDNDQLPARLQTIRLLLEDVLLSPEEQLNKARDLVFGKRYSLSKGLIDGNVSLSANSLLTFMQQRQKEVQDNLHATMVQQFVLISIIFAEMLAGVFLLLRKGRRQ